MDIKSSLASQSAAQSYGGLKGSTAIAGNNHQADQQSVLSLTQDFADSLAQSEGTAKSGLVGAADAQSVVTAMASAELAVETAVTLRNKVVEAYQEILRMPV